MSETPVAKLLIVDDEAAQMKALCDTLRDRGYDVTGFASPRQALQAMNELTFDLLLSDLMMPEMDGITFLQAAQRKDPSLVGIIMTGEGTIGTAVEAMKSGALDYILKPFKLSAVVPILDRALTMRRLREENVRLERRVRERTAELEATNKELEAFSYSVSHDLRAPLRHISGYAEMMGESPVAPLCEEDKRFLEKISEGAKKMRRLIDDLLDFSRTGRSELRRSKIKLDDILEQTLQDIQPETQGRSIIFEKHPLPVVQADPALLRQVFSNLLLNAVKYTRPRNPAKIEIGGQLEPEVAVIYVRDNGVGFDPEYADKLFGVFQRLHSPNEFEGTGVGLANVRRIVTRHGGRTWAEGRPGEGATFYFSLPR
jgi:two-component system, sensor histidine kinase and response regulator